MRTHYDNLHVSEKAGPEVIKGAYKALAQKWHPDKHPDQREKAEHYFKIITRAFEVLSDPKARAEYDAWLETKRGVPETDPEPVTANEYVPPVPPVKNPTVQEVMPIYPWRRFFARFIDTLLITSASGFVAGFLFAAIFNVDISEHFEDSLLSWIALGAISVVIVETLLVSSIATTPGKFIFGIHVKAKSGGKPGISNALERSVLANLIGQGACIPFAGVITYPISYALLKKNGAAPWDNQAGTELICKPLKTWRWVSCALITAIAMLINGALLKAQVSEMKQRPEPWKEAPIVSTGQQANQNNGRLAPYDGTYTPLAQAQSPLPTPTDDAIHFQKIYSAHPDADTIVADPAFTSWTSSNSERGRIVESGTADEVIGLLSSYKAYRATLRQPQVPTATRPRNPYPDCVIRQTMTDADYAACGIKPPGR
ncbi:hypothetical protein EGJ23_01720 [Pseudomonas sp. o96-267]|uniref:DnaJ domain-containing protein n=1 Tax=Pseudomonas sp. o96-267 TaxID=2479853 RepID=UPI000F7A9B9C|nr:DnaJ domain-containing protein [Pseudomonas sp. o96-267]RRV29682.1 hypothetical protein EGJ23_01720 [Pseudomonas sp. o96-267]